MKRLAVIALGAALFVGVAVAGSGRRGMLERPLVLRGAVSTSPLLGLEYRSTQAWLERLDRRTLKRLSGRRLGLAEFSGGWSYSPDRSLLAFGNQSSTALTYLPARIRLINAYTLRKVRDVPLGLTGEVMYTYWVAPARLLALVQSREDSGTEGERPIATDRVIVVDPTTGAVRATEKLEGTVAALAKADHALALVLEGKSYGPVRLVVADDNSTLDSVTLDGVRAGLHQTPAGVPRVDGVAVAVDRQRGRAYVVAAGEPVAEAALATLTVEYHVPSEPVSLLGRLHNWLEPPAHAKGPLEGSWRSAVWLGGGRLAVFGRDNSTYSTGDGLAVRERPSGLVVIDTQNWASHMVDPDSSAIVVATQALVSWGWSWDGGTERLTGAGLSIYDQKGVRRFHLFGARVVSDVQVVGRRAFVWRAGLDGRYSIVDLSAGRQLRTIRGRAVPLVLNSAGAPFYP